MEPFILPEEVLNHILRYLNFSDIIQASLVSKYWHQVIGNSKVCMQKLQLRYQEFGNPAKNIEFLLKSERCYQHVFFFVFTHNYCEIIHNNIRRIIIKFANSLTFIKSTLDIPRIPSLPKLKEVKLFINYYENWNLHNYGLTSVTSLERLMIQCVKIDKNSVEIFKSNLKEMDNLEALAISDPSLLTDFQEYKFKLKEFRMIGYNYESVHNFIKAHKSTLEVIDYENVSFNDLHCFLTEFPKLHTLKVENILNCGCALLMQLPINNNIQTLQIKKAIHGKIHILGAFPNLRVLKVDDLDSILNIIHLLESIKTIEYEYKSPFAEYFLTQYPNIQFIHNFNIKTF